MKQAKIFDFKIGVITSEKFRKKLNGQEDPHPEFLNTIASNACENCIVINKRHVQVVNDLSTGERTVMTADYGRVPHMMIEDNGELNMTVNQSPKSPAEIDENLNNELNDAEEVIQSLYEQQSSSPSVVDIPVNDWVPALGAQILDNDPRSVDEGVYEDEVESDEDEIPDLLIEASNNASEGN